MLDRRTLLLGGGSRLVVAAAGLSLTLPASAQVRRRSREEPLRLGVDGALADCGLARTLAAAFGRHTGLPVAPVPAPTSAMLTALEHGEVDAGLGLAPEPERRLEQQGLIHDRRAIARTGFVLVGPASRGVLPAGVLGAPDAAQALAQIAAAQLPFLGRNDGSGAHWLEQSLWRAAAVAPAAPWLRALGHGADPLEAARQHSACALVERPRWLAGRRNGLVALAEHDARLTVPVHVMRPFRADHPSATLFVRWLTTGAGKGLAARHPGFLAAT
jgi:tungstate transport system substrate-binding protein